MDKFLVRTSSTESLSNKRPAESNIWRQPKRVANPSKTSSQVKFATQNRFKDLADDSDGDQEQAPHQLPDRRVKTGRIPPIIVEVKPDWTHKSLTELVTKFAKQFHLQYRQGNKVAIHCHSDDGHRMVADGLRAENFLFHTFSRKEERTYKVVIRGIPGDTIPMLRDELAEMGFATASVNMLKSASEKHPACPPLLVQLPAVTDIVKFKQIKYLCRCVVKIEKFKPKTSSGTQCYRCQQFGHASRNCNLSERCVKCTGSHATKTCPKTDRTSPAQCCNCKGDHPANYRQCPARVEYLQRLSQKRHLQSNKPNLIPLSENRRTAIRAEPVSQARGQIRSFATAATSSYSEQATPLDASKEQDAATIEMLHILNTIKRVKYDFQACTNMMDKVILVLQHLGQYV